MTTEPSIQDQIAELKERLRRTLDGIESLDRLAGRVIDADRVPDVWEMDDADLEADLWRRLQGCESALDVRPAGPIGSHRRLLGGLVVGLKRGLRRLTRPYSALLLERQNRLNREFFELQLRTFLLQRSLRRRLAELENQVGELEERSPLAGD